MRSALLVLALFSTLGFAQLPARPADPTIGVVADPCSVLPSPPDASAYSAAVERARKKGVKPPEPPPQLRAAWKRHDQEMLVLDFANFCRYSAENLRLPPATNHRVVMMGDSITEGWSRFDPTLFTNDVINRGISGQTTPQMLVRFRADVLDLHPKVVHFLLATNDIAGNTGPTTLKRIEDSVASMAELAHAEHVTVLLGSVLPASNYPWRPALKPIDSITQLNAWLKNYAKANGFVYVDYYSAMQDGAYGMRKELTLDGVHPNAAGYEVMRNVLLPILAEAQKK